MSGARPQTARRSPERRYDAIIVGAGYGGVTAAAVLADRGLKVLLIDKNARPGGKAMRAMRDGVGHDLWPIAGGPTQGSRFQDLARLLSLPASAIIEPDPAAEFIYLAPDGGRRSLVVPSRPTAGLREMIRLVSAFGIRPWQLGGAIAMNLISNGLPTPLLDRLDGVSMLTWMDRFRLPQPLRDWTMSLMNLFFVVPVDLLPASEAIRTLRDVAKGGAGRYHRGGYGAIAEEAARFVEAKGGCWLPDTHAHRILIREGRAAGVSTTRGEFEAPVVISNAGIQPTVLRLLEEGAISAEYVDRVRRLKPSWAFVGVRYDLDAPFFKVPMTVVFSPESGWDTARFARAERGEWPTNPLLFITVPSLYDPALGSRRRPQVALAGVLGSPDPSSPMNGAAMDKMEEMVARLWPSLAPHISRRQRFGAAQVSATTRDAVVPGQGGECVGLGQLIGQCGRSKPKPRAPLKGLYFVGCDSGGRGIGTTQAVDSGFNVAELVLRDRAGDVRGNHQKPSPLPSPRRGPARPPWRTGGEGQGEEI
ncbi:MAG: NAD(P)/FAD-dependent oxidoreductase [Nitrospirae bacterium]|nr:NAD(P)/FAD-dependent oxidoreductase [Nitrospirota bacterium]